LRHLTSRWLSYISPLLASRLRYLHAYSYSNVENLGAFLPHCVVLEALHVESTVSIAPALNALAQPLHTVRELKLLAWSGGGSGTVCVDTARAIIRALPALSTLTLEDYEFTDEARVVWGGSALRGVTVTYSR